MKKSALLIILCVCILPFSYSQKEANHWYFGFGAGLDFSSGSLKLDASSQMYVDHGSAVASDEDGNLLFYTNGTAVWNRNHDIMPNGTLPEGSASSSTMQNCAIVPKVGTPNVFYIFTINTVSDENEGLRTHIVDMSLNDNRGDITETSTPIVDSLLAGCALTQHTNGTDYWLVLRALTNVSNIWREKLLIYLIDENGINLASSFLTNADQAYVLNQNTGKFSPNGKLLYWGSNVYDFDHTTGTIPGFTALLDQPFLYSRGEFAPSGNIIYVFLSGGDNSTLDQYDLRASDVQASKISVDIETDNQSYTKGGIQLAPDGKIYVSYLGNIGVINSPENLGVACGLEQSSIDVPGSASWHFPVFSSHLFKPIFTNTEHQSVEHSVDIFPNPAGTALNIRQDAIHYTHCALVHLNATSLLEQTINSEQFRIDVSTIPSGIYLLRLSNQDTTVVKKVIIHNR